MNQYHIINTRKEDLPLIYQLFEEAILFQKRNDYTGWSSYDKEFIQGDIKNGLSYKIVAQNQIICTFSICHSDAVIWRQKEKGQAVYLHRIVLNQQFKGERVFQKILDWTIQFAHERNLKYIRMDTWAANEKLISYYKSYGFLFIENYLTPDSDSLPLQHRNLNVALLELSIPAIAQSKHTYKDYAMQTPTNKPEKVNIIQQLSTINTYWNQKIIGEANGQLIKLAKGSGEINWHKHEEQDELFILYKGHLTIQLRAQNIELYPDEMFIVPKGTEHCPISHGDSYFLIMGLNITSNAAGGRPDKYDNEI